MHLFPLRRKFTRENALRTFLPALVVSTALSCAKNQRVYDFAGERARTAVYAVGPGDVLQIRAWKNENLSQRVTVRPDGFVSVPLVGEVLAGGRTVEEIGRDIAGRAAKFYTEQLAVSVEVAELHSYRIYVLGEVSHPGEFTPRGQVTVLQALALAGGFTRFAAPNEVVIVRRDKSGERRIPFAYSQVVDRGSLDQNLPLQSNDTVVVP